MTRGTSRIRPPHVGAAIDRYPLHAGPTAANLQQRVCCSAPALGQTDGRTDTVPFIDPAAHTMRTVPITVVCKNLKILAIRDCSRTLNSSKKKQKKTRLLKIDGDTCPSTPYLATRVVHRSILCDPVQPNPSAD